MRRFKFVIPRFFCAVLLSFIIFSCSKDDGQVPSSQNIINSFKFIIDNEVVTGDINQNDQTISFNLVGADINALIPTISYSEKALIDPANEVPQNFTNQVNYTVTAENGETRVYTVIVNNRSLGTESKILEFSILNNNNETITATINEELKEIRFDALDFDLSAIVPEIRVSEYASVNPEVGTPINLNGVVEYIVTAENGEESTYRVIGNEPIIQYVRARHFNSRSVYSNAELLISGKFINPEVAEFALYLENGNDNFDLEILSSESYVSENTRVYNLYVKMPISITTSDSYRVVYENSNFTSKSENIFNVVSENIPIINSLDKENYNVDEVVTISGSNLTEQLVIPNNGNLYLVDDCCGSLYNYQLNTDRTQLKFKLDRQVYGWSGPVRRSITLLGAAWRVGPTVYTNFGGGRTNSNLDHNSSFNKYKLFHSMPVISGKE